MSGRTAIRLLLIGVAVSLVPARFAMLDAASHSASDTLRPWAIEVIVIAASAILVLHGLAFVERLIERQIERRP